VGLGTVAIVQLEHLGIKIVATGAWFFVDRSLGNVCVADYYPFKQDTGEHNPALKMM